MALVKASEIKKMVKEGNKRCSKDFIAALDAAVAKKVMKCIADHNAGKKTLDAGVVHMIFGA
jgi:hypothetical protein